MRLIPRGVPALTVASGFVLFVAIGSAVPTWAHHSFGATFDANKPVTITGRPMSVMLLTMNPPPILM